MAKRGQKEGNDNITWTMKKETAAGQKEAKNKDKIYQLQNYLELHPSGRRYSGNKPSCPPSESVGGSCQLERDARRRCIRSTALPQRIRQSLERLMAGCPGVGLRSPCICTMGTMAIYSRQGWCRSRWNQRSWSMSATMFASMSTKRTLDEGFKGGQKRHYLNKGKQRAFSEDQ